MFSASYNKPYNLDGCQAFVRSHVTKKLADKLSRAGCSIEDSPAEHASVLDSRHANITTIQRRQCLVFTHDKTRFTIALLGVTQKELKQLSYWFEDLLVNTLLKAGLDPELIEAATQKMGPLQFDTTCDRSVQGTLRLMIHRLEAYSDGIDVMELPIYSTSVWLSERPCWVKGETQKKVFLFPRQEMERLLLQLHGS